MSSRLFDPPPAHGDLTRRQRSVLDLVRQHEAVGVPSEQAADVAYTSAQLGHESPSFTLTVYVQETKRRERLTGAERREYDRAVEWAQWARMGTNDLAALPTVAASENGSQRDAATDAELNEWSVPGSNR